LAIESSDEKDMAKIRITGTIMIPDKSSIKKLRKILDPLFNPLMYPSDFEFFI
jgi:hypothetical protein